MKKIIPNPEYEKAKHSLGWIAHGRIGGVGPHPKFKEPMPKGMTHEQLSEWIRVNAIWPTIEVDELSHNE